MSSEKVEMSYRCYHSIVIFIDLTLLHLQKVIYRNKELLKGKVVGSHSIPYIIKRLIYIGAAHSIRHQAISIYSLIQLPELIG